MISAEKIIALKYDNQAKLLTDYGRIYMKIDNYYTGLWYSDKQDFKIYSIRSIGNESFFLYHRHTEGDKILNFGSNEEDFLSHVKENHPEFFEWILWNLL